MKRPRLVASDLDGTLLAPDGTVSPRTAAAWSRLPALGIESVLVTARPPRWLHPLQDIVGAHGLAICANGAFVYDVSGRTLLQSQGIERSLVCELVAELRAELPGVGFAAELADGLHMEHEYPDLHSQWVPADAVRAPMDDLADTAVVGKLLARSMQVPEQWFLDRVAELVGDRAVVSYSGAGGLAEIAAAGVTKASALARWCAARGIDAADVWAFGDMPNDLPMLRWAGTSYAMANAHPDVRAAAGHVCPSNADDGVAQVLEGLGDG
ncbi:HAD family hydrolase [Flexivirga meconopsidis]|uniref:HAD family hydrolase n=1 Tax=Flexivirga meconopsidis TaxID=2977121 RepID=UPI00223EAB00